MKTIKSLLLLALMLFGVAGAAWALPRAPQKFTGPVSIYDLMDGDTLAPGFSLTYGHDQYENIYFANGRYSTNGTPQATPYNGDLTNSELQGTSFTAGNIIFRYEQDGIDTLAPMVDMNTPGNAWVVSDFYRAVEGVTLTLSGIEIVIDYPVQDAAGNWLFQMPGANKLVHVQYTYPREMGNYVVYSTGVDQSKWYTLDNYTQGTVTGAFQYSENIDLPFEFEYNGVAYTQWAYNTDAEIMLGMRYPTDMYRPDNDSSLAIVLMGGFHGHIDGNSYVRWQTFGTAPNRVFVIEYHFRHFYEEGVYYNMQAQLAENGSITIVYGNANASQMDFSFWCGLSHTGSVYNESDYNFNEPKNAYYYINRTDHSYLYNERSSKSDWSWPGQYRWYTFSQTFDKCKMVDSLTYTVTPTNITLQWQDNDNAAGVSYNVVCFYETIRLDPQTHEPVFDYYNGGYVHDTVWVTEQTGDVFTSTSATFDNLNPNTNYTVIVRSQCSATNLSEAIKLTVKTPCFPVATAELPYLMRFNEDEWDGEKDYDKTPRCWDKLFQARAGETLSSHVSEFIRKANNYNTGNRYLHMEITPNPIASIAILPAFDTALSALSVSFLAEVESDVAANAKFEVGYITDIDDTATFTAVETFTTANGLVASEGFDNAMINPGEINVEFRGVTADARMAIRLSCIDPNSWMFPRVHIDSVAVEIAYNVDVTVNNDDFGTAAYTKKQLVAMPDSAHYLVRWENAHGTLVGTDNPQAVTVTSDTAFVAVFAAKPVLTLAQNEGGVFEAVVQAGGVTATHITSDQIPTWQGSYDPVMEADLQPFGFVAVDSAAARTWTDAPALGDAYLIYDFTGDYYKAHLFRDGQWADWVNDYFYKGNFYLFANLTYFTTGTIAASGVVATTEPNKYYVDYNTDVTVVATPDATHYLKNFVGGADTNSNVAVNTTFTVTADTTLTANFQAKPTLTLTANDGGTLTLDGVTDPTPATATIQFAGNNNTVTVSNVPLPHTFSCNYSTTNGELDQIIKSLYEISSGYNQPAQPPTASGNDNVTAGLNVYNHFITISAPFDGTATVTGGGYWNMTGNETVFEYNLTITILSSTPGSTGLPAGVVSANATLDTFVVDYNTDLTVTATPDATHYLATLGEELVNSNDSIHRTFTMTAPVNLPADFRAKPTLTLAQTDGGTLAAIIPEAAPASVTVQFEANGNTVTREVTLPYTFWCYNQAENGELDTIIRQLYGLTGGWCSTPGGTPTASGNDNVTAGYDDYDGWRNHIITISAPFDGTATVEGRYKGNPSYFTYSLTISTIYTPATAANVVRTAEPNTYIIDYGTPVTVKATPEVHHHLVEWSCTPGTIVDNLDSTATLDSMIADQTVTATFAKNAPELAWEYDNVILANGDTISGYHGFEMDTIAKLIFSSNDEFFDAYMNALQNTGTSLLRFGSSNTNVVSFADAFDPQSLSVNAPGTATVYMVHDGSVMAYDSAYFTAVILAPDTLTLVHNDGGDMEVELSSATVWNSETWAGWPNQAGIEKTIGDITLLGGESTYLYDNNGNLGIGVMGGVIPESSPLTISTTGNKFTRIEMTMTEPASTGDRPKPNIAPADGWTVTPGSTLAVWEGNADTVILSSCTTNVSQIVFYRSGANSADSIRAIVADTTYAVVPGANVTVKAMPDSAHYLVNWDNDAAINYNFDTTKVYTVNGNMTSTATFNIKPTLTLAANDTTWGKVMLAGMNDAPATPSETPVETEVTFLPNEFEGVTSAPYQLTKGDITVSVSNGTCSTAYNHIRVFKNATFTVSSASGNIKSVSFTCTDMNTTNYGPGCFGATAGYEYDHYNGSWTGDAASMTLTASENQVRITNITVVYDSTYGGTTTVFPDGVAQIDATTYRVDYGTEVTVIAHATELHHVANWENQNGDNLHTATYTDYFITEPTELFPSYSSLTITLTGDTMVRAMFGINSYDVVATTTLDDRVSGAPLLMGTVEATYFDIEGAERSIAADTNLTLTAQGGSTTTLVAKAEYGYLFKHWTAGNGIYLSDTLRVSEATDAKAVFVPDTFTVTLAANDSLMGSAVIAGMDASTDGTYAIPYLSEMNVMAVPASRCFDFAAWSNIAETTAVSIQTVTLTGDTSITATFVRHDFPGDTTASECDLFAWHDSTYTLTPAEAPAYLYLTPDGCDSTVTLHLTVRHSNTGVETATACDQYEWQGTVYTKSDTLDQRTLTNIEGCDSVVTLNLTVNYHHDTTVYWQTSGDFVWGRGTSYEETFVENGTYNRTIDTKQGCDSNVTIVLAYLPHTTPLPTIYNIMGVSLFINHFPEGTDKIDYIYYRWYKNGEVVSEGEGVDSYSEDGDMLNGCFYLEISTEPTHTYWAKSNEVCLGNLGIDGAKDITMTMAPNPVVRGQQVTVVVSESNLQGAIATVYDAQGRQVENIEVKNSSFNIQTSNLTAGIYTVRIVLSDGRMATKKVVVR